MRRVNVASIRNTAVNLCLLLVSGMVGLALCEVSLRLFYPKYQHLTEARFQSDTIRLLARTPNHRDWMGHPDISGSPHPLYHNNFALRQHRDFSEADLAAATNIGIFGDSFVENIFMAAQYSFTEPLDHLLNQGQKRFNVLNFGVHGYGPGQSLLHYQHFHYAEDLDHVLFVYSENDLRELYIHGLFHLDEAGHLVRNEMIRSSWGTSLLRGLHILYLALDVSGRLSSVMAETMTNTTDLKRGFEERCQDERRQTVRRAIRDVRLTDNDPKNGLEFFRLLIRHWKHVAAYNGSTFSVVLLPKRPEPVIADLLEAEDVESIDLYDCFGRHDPVHNDREWVNSPYRFRNDSHWNEAGNRLAAICLYRVLEEKMEVSRLSEGELRDAIFRYYAAFEGRISTESRGQGGGGEGRSPRRRQPRFGRNTWHLR